MGILPACDSVSNSVSVTASDVNDKDSLKAFVLSAKEHLEKNYELAVEDFRTKEKWRKGPVYLYAIGMDGVRLFHVAKPKLEGTKGSSQGEKEIIESILKAAKNGKGFVEYPWDNPAIEGEDQSSKVGYTVIFEKDGKEYALGSGFYYTGVKGEGN